MKHSPTQMSRGLPWPRNHTGLSGRRWNVWHFTASCPTCGRKIHPLVNPNRRRVFLCSGQTNGKSVPPQSNGLAHPGETATHFPYTESQPNQTKPPG